MVQRREGLPQFPSQLYKSHSFTGLPIPHLQKQRVLTIGALKILPVLTNPLQSEHNSRSAASLTIFPCLSVSSNLNSHGHFIRSRLRREDGQIIEGETALVYSIISA